MGDLFVGIGTGPGMGMTTASRFARGGFDLVLASKNTSKLEPLADELRRSTGRNVETVSLEATDPTAVQALADRVGDRVGVLHYNVAIMEKTGIETSVDDFRRNLEVDITGAFAAIRSFVPGMETRHKGTILLTGGGYALNPNADYLALSIGKAGIRCIAQALFKPLAKRRSHRDIHCDQNGPRRLRRCHRRRRRFLAAAFRARRELDLGSQPPVTWQAGWRVRSTGRRVSHRFVTRMTTEETIARAALTGLRCRGVSQAWVCPGFAAWE